MFNLGSLKSRLVIFLSVFGPATIAAMADNDGAGVATYSLAGAKFGYSILFILIPLTVLLAITQEMGVRTAMVTGKGFGDLIRESYGVGVSVLVFFLLLIANMGTITANMAAIQSTSRLFSLPSFLIVVAMIVLAYLFISKGNYRTNQNIFLLAALFYIAYIISAFKARPDWNQALTSLFIPTGIKLSKEFIFGAIAVVGTTITPWGQFFINSYVLDKKLTVEKIKYEQFETYMGASLTNFFTFFMIVATAATLFVHGITLVTGDQAALAIKPFAGNLASVLFGLGILNAGFMGIIIVSLSTAYAFAEFFGYVGSLDAPYERGRLFYGLFLFQLIVAGLIVAIPTVSLFKIVFYTQALNGILLPFVLFFLLKITNNKELMGAYTNNKFFNYFAVISAIIITIAAVFTVVSSLTGL